MSKRRKLEKGHIKTREIKDLPNVNGDNELSDLLGILIFIHPFSILFLKNL